MNETKPEIIVEHNKPVGIGITAGLTLIASAIIGFLDILINGVWGMATGATGQGGGLPPFYYTVTIPMFIMALYAFVLSIFMFFKDSRYVWHGAMVFWILDVIAFVPYWMMLSPRFGEADLLTFDFVILAVPLVYSVSCIAYFMTSHIRKYFGV